MSDIQTTYKLTLKDGVYYKKDGSPYPKPFACNLQKGRLTKAGFKVTVVPVEGGYGMRVLDLNNRTANAPTPAVPVEAQEKPTEGHGEKSVEELRKELAELEEREELKRKIAEKRSASGGDNGIAPVVTRGNAPAGRPKRKKYERNRLKFPNRPGYRRRVFNDVESGMHVKAAEAAGWTQVSDPLAVVDSDDDVNRPSQMGSPVSRHVGTGKDGKPMLGVLMEIPEEWFNEDQAERQAEVTRAEEGLRQVSKDGVEGGLTVSGVEDEANRRI